MSFFPTQDVVKFGPRTYTDLDGAFWMSAGGTSQGHTTFRKFGVASGYQIPDATNLKVIGVRIFATTTVSFCTLGYADNAVENAVAASVTNPVYMSSNALSVDYYNIVGGTNYNSSSTGFAEWHLDWNITVASTPGKYPFFFSDASSMNAYVLVKEY